MKKSRSKLPFSCGCWGGVGWKQEFLVGGRRLVGTGFLPFFVPRWRPKEPHDGLAGGGKQLGKGEACVLSGSQLQVLPLDFSYPGLLAFSSLEKTDFQMAGEDRWAEKGQGLLPTATASRTDLHGEPCPLGPG